MEALIAVNFVIGLIIAAIIGVLIGRNAASRGMSAIGWGLFAFLICIVAIPIYPIVRRPRLNERT
jgi:membrane protein YdbS with pleckstrin-like domain